MKLELERLVYPEAAEEVDCALCERPFTLGLVIARAVFWGNAEGGEVCPECATYLAAGPMGESGRFPTEEDYARLAGEWGTPEFASAEEYEAWLREQDERWRGEEERREEEARRAR